MRSGITESVMVSTSGYEEHITRALVLMDEPDCICGTVINAIRKMAFKLTNDRIATPELVEPFMFFVEGGQYFSWRGSAWADTYEVWVNVCDLV